MGIPHHIPSRLYVECLVFSMDKSLISCCIQAVERERYPSADAAQNIADELFQYSMMSCTIRKHLFP